jgi:NADH-quinone oxidoreductase subunit G
LALANWIGQHTSATVGYLTEAANTVGAQFVCALPGAQGKTAADMLGGQLKALLLLNTEPAYDTASGAKARAQLAGAEMVVTLSPFKANMDISDVLLPIAPFTETPGTFVNAEGRVQSFHAVVKPLAETRPAWKVVRVVANMLGLSGFDFESSQDVLADVFKRDGAVPTHIDAKYLGNHTQAVIDLGAPQAPPVVASIYQLDGLVRRAASLQCTADARAAADSQQATKEPA